MMKYNRMNNRFLLMFCMAFLGMLCIPEQKATAAGGPVTIQTVDYEEENIIVNNNGNSRIYFATETDAAKDFWEVLDIDNVNTTTIDFSWVSPAADNVVRIKGEDDSTQARVTLLEKTKKLDISINYANIAELAKTDTIASILNIMTTAGTAKDPIRYSDLEWKKGDGGKWKGIDELTVAQLEKYQIKGTYLYLRISAVNDITDAVLNTFPDGTKGRRASSEVKLKITKKLPPMVIGIDGTKFTADIKYGKEYRVTITVGATTVTSDWIQITDRAAKKLALSIIANNGSNGTTELKAFPKMDIEIRNYSTSKAASSKITEIALEPQRIIEGEVIEEPVPEDATSADNNIYISYNGTKNMIITIPSASLEEPYQYCVAKYADDLDMERVVWTTITKNTAVKVLASKAVEGETLYVRQKEIKSRSATRTTPAVGYELASTYVTHSIRYPSSPEVNNKSLTYTKGYPEEMSFTVKLNVIGKKPFETEIKNIKLGTKEMKFESTVSPVIPDPISDSTEYTMTVTLKSSSLESMTNCTNKPITIYFGNGTVDKTSIKLSIISPIPAYTLTTTIAKGTVTSTTAITVVSSLGAGNSFIYTIGPKVENRTMSDKQTIGAEFTSGADIIITADDMDKYLTIYEIDSVSKNIVKFKSIQITAEILK